MTLVNTSKAQKVSPMMEHYRNTKEKYSDCVVFYRLGDFYEMFDDDAVNMSRELDLTLTSKECGNNQKAPMCGIPVKSVDLYIQKALELGHKIAICEQLTDPKPGEIVERDVIRVITPGTIMEESLLDERKNNFIMCLYYSQNGSSISWCDITTGEFNATEISKNDSLSAINDLITMIAPAEIICNADGLNIENEILNLEHKYKKRLILLHFC